MKDLNEFMQAILDMDTAQRKASQQAKEDREQKLAHLEESKRQIAQEYAKKAETAVKEAVEQAQEQNRQAIQQLQQRTDSAIQRLSDEVEKCEEQWVEQLFNQVLNSGDAGCEVR